MLLPPDDAAMLWKNVIGRGVCIALVGIISIGIMSKAEAQVQTNEDAMGSRWLAAADVAPEFEIPKSRHTWERKRKEVRAELNVLLGKLPPRPRVPNVQTLSREDRGDFFLEKFQFDNGAGSIVRGYLVLPKNVKGKAP